jgi:hypothetical protein
VPPALFLLVKFMDKVKGRKLETVQRFTQDGHRIPVTKIKVENFADFKAGDLLESYGNF